MADGNAAPLLAVPGLSPADLRRRLRQRVLAARQLGALLPHGGYPLVAGVLVVQVMAGALPVVFLVCVGDAVGQLRGLAAGASGGTLIWPVAGAAAAFLGHQAISAVQLWLSQVLARRIDAYCSHRLMDSALRRASLPALERADVADELAATVEALDSQTLTPGAAAEGALGLVARYVQLLGAVGVLVATGGPWLALAAAAVALVARRGQTAAFFRWGQVVRRMAPVRRRMTYVRDLVVGTRAAKEIRTLDLVDWLDARYDADAQAFLRPLWRWRRRVYGVPFLLYSAVALVGLVIALGALTRMGAATTGQLSRLTMALQAIVVCARFGVIFPESDVKMIYGRSAYESLLEFERRTAEGTDTGPKQHAGPPQRAITFEDVSFRYPGADRPVLEHLDLELVPGTSTGLVGVNGAGKTTLVKLLVGYYQPESGRIASDGTDLRELDPNGWRGHFAVAFQDFVRYEFSLADNVAMSASGHRDDEAGIRAELIRVGLGDLLDELPAGLDTPLHRLAGGTDLSGGQWQRVALARSLFAVRHGASVLVLDEPTAALDARGEAEFYATFLDLTRGVTSLVISHRGSSIRRADRIVVIDGGRVAEAGTHDDLLAREGAYARLFRSQARRFAEPEDAA